MNEQKIVETKKSIEGEAHFFPKDRETSYITDTLIGILKDTGDAERAREERLRKKYAED